jgi:NADH dehydrogenase [ubiquinone] 1 alpha subcomplex assembly factor 5
MSGSRAVFDRRLLRRRRDRAAAGFATHDFLLCEVAERLADRLADVRRRFPLALELGCHAGQLGRTLLATGKLDRLVRCDHAPAMVRRADGPRLVADEEYLPFADDSLDLVASALALQWVNDLPGTLVQVRRALKPDGLFLAALLGGESLRELRRSLLEAETAIEGGASPRVAPFVDVRAAGALLQRAGFALPVAEAETITVTYPDVFCLMADLRGMGAANALADRRRGFTRRSTLLTAVATYRRRFADARGRLPATFQVLFLTGWKPDPSQQQPARRGSGAVSLAEALAVPPPPDRGANGG